MGLIMAYFHSAAICAVRNLVMDVIERRKFKDQVDFFEKLHIKFQIFYLMRLPPARLSTPYLQKIGKRVSLLIFGGLHFEEVHGKIEEGLDHKESQYMLSWRETDEIQKIHLHISLHSAGCFLNPRYSECSGSESSDPTIAEDMNLFMIHMGEDPCVQYLKKHQVEKHRTRELLIEKHRTR